MSDNHVLVPKVDLLMAIDDLRLNGYNHSADLLKKALFAPIAAQAQPDHDAVDLAREGMGLHSTGAPEYIVCAELVRIAESAQLVDRSPEMQRNPVDESPNLQSQQCWCRTCLPETLSEVRMILCPNCSNKRCPHANDHRNTCTGSNEPGQPRSAYPSSQPSGNSGELPPMPDALVDALSNLEHDNYERSYSGSKNRESDAALIRAALAQMVEPRLDKPAKVGGSRFSVGIKWSTVITAAQRLYGYEVTPEKEAERIAGADQKMQALWHHIAAQAQQDADKVNAALAEMVHAMFRSGNSVPVTRITIDRKQYEATIDAARKEQA